MVAGTSSDDGSERLRKRLTGHLREIRTYLRGGAEYQPSGDTICAWIQLAYQLECWTDVVDLGVRLYEDDADPWLYQQAQRLLRVARYKAQLAHAR